MSFLLQKIRKELDKMALTTNIYFTDDRAKADFAVPFDPEESSEQHEQKLDLLLSTKGSSLLELYDEGVRIPPAFIISTEYSLDFLSTSHKSEEGHLHDGNFFNEVLPSAIIELERRCDMRFGEVVPGKHPMLLAIRVGSPLSLGSLAQQPPSNNSQSSQSPRSSQSSLASSLFLPPLMMPLPSNIGIKLGMGIESDTSEDNDENTSALWIESGHFAGAQESMLHVGLNNRTTEHLGLFLGLDRALSMYATFIMKYGVVVLGENEAAYLKILEDLKTTNGRPTFSVADYRLIIYQFQLIQRIPDDPFEQISTIIKAAYTLWWSKDSITFRSRFLLENARDCSPPSSRLKLDAESIGVAIIVQKVEFGGSGVVRTRDEKGKRRLVGEFRSSDTNSDSHSIKISISDFMNVHESAFAKLREIAYSLEEFYRDMVQIEFVLDEEGDVLIIRCEPSRRSSTLALKVAQRMLFESLVTEAEAIKRVDIRRLCNGDGIYDNLNSKLMVGEQNLHPDLNFFVEISGKYVNKHVYSIVSSSLTDEQLSYFHDNVPGLGDGVVLKTDFMFDSISEVKILVRQLFFSGSTQNIALATEKLVSYQKDEIKKILRLQNSVRKKVASPSDSNSNSNSNNHDSSNSSSIACHSFPVYIQLLEDPLSIYKSFPSNDREISQIATAENYSVWDIKTAFKTWNLQELSSNGVKGIRLLDKISFIYEIQIRAILQAQMELQEEGGIESGDADVHILLTRIANQSELDYYSTKLKAIISQARLHVLQFGEQRLVRRSRESMFDGVDEASNEACNNALCDIDVQSQRQSQRECAAEPALSLGFVGNSPSFCFSKKIESKNQFNLTSTIFNLDDITSTYFGCQMPHEHIFGSYEDSGLFGLIREGIKTQKPSKPQPHASAPGLFGLNAILGFRPFATSSTSTATTSTPAIASAEDQASESHRGIMCDNGCGIIDVPLEAKAEARVGVEIGPHYSLDYRALRLLSQCDVDFVICPLRYVNSTKIMLAQIALDDITSDSNSTNSSSSSSI